MHKQWQWICPIGQSLMAMWCQHAHASGYAARNGVRCGAARGVEQRRRAWCGGSAGSGERFAGSVA